MPIVYDKVISHRTFQNLQKRNFTLFLQKIFEIFHITNVGGTKFFTKFEFLFVVSV